MKKLLASLFLAVIAAYATITADNITATASPALTGTFSAYASSSNGFAQAPIGSIIMQFTASTSPATAQTNYSCNIVYDAVNGWIYLNQDTGTQYGQNYGMPGWNKVLSNSQCSFNVSGVTVGQLGNQRWFTVPVTFAASYAGQKYMWEYVNPCSCGPFWDNPSGWQSKGLWTVGNPPSPPTTALVSPGSGSGASQTFTFSATDAAGAADIASTWIIFATNGSIAVGCGIRFMPDGIQMLNDAASAWSSSIPIGSAGQLDNNQCTIPASTASKSSAGNTNYYTFTATFKPSFAGVKLVLGLSANNAGQYLQPFTLGTWTIDAASFDTQFSLFSVDAGVLVPDDYTGTMVTSPTSITPFSTVKLRNGREIKIKRADQIKVSKLSHSNARAGDSYKYTFHVDTREVYMIRLGLGDADGFAFGDDPTLEYRAQLTQPKNWSMLTTGWAELPGAVKSENSEFTYTSKYLPGPMPMFLSSSDLMIPYEPTGNTADDMRIVSAMSYPNNSLVKWVIGPAIKPDITKEEFHDLIGRWVENYRFEFLRPLLDGKTIDELPAPAGEFEQEILKCLRDAIPKA